MKIVIDGRWIGKTGIGRYVEELVKRLPALDPSNDYTVLISDDAHAKFNYNADNIAYVAANERVYTIDEQLGVWRLLRRARARLVHFPSFAYPILYSARPFVITIHDFTMLHWTSANSNRNKLFGYNVKQLPMRLTMWLGVHRSRAILAPSQFVKDEIVRRFHIKPRKITVTYESAELPYQKPRVKLTKFSITKPFILYVGNLQGHKNIERLILALGKLNTDYLLDYQLVLAGGARDDAYKKVEADVRKANLTDRVIFTGYVTDAELAGLYKAAAIYSFPSLSEGFGLPGLEAMSYGLPVASSNATCLPEIYGDAAVYYDPENIDEMARVLAELIADKDLQEKLRERGYQQVKKYSWDECARQTLAVYKRALRSR